MDFRKPNCSTIYYQETLKESSNISSIVVHQYSHSAPNHDPALREAEPALREAERRFKTCVYHRGGYLKNVKGTLTIYEERTNEVPTDSSERKFMFQAVDLRA